VPTHTEGRIEQVPAYKNRKRRFEILNRIENEEGERISKHK
jgi:hypothetical protein